MRFCLLFRPFFLCTRTFDHYFVYFHFPTFNHLAPYFIGILTGYVLTSKDQIAISRVSAVCEREQGEATADACV